MDTNTSHNKPSVQLISSPLRASIIITLFISAGGLVWACFARVPIYVDGFALMLRDGNSRRLVSRTEGEINHIFHSKNVAARQRDRDLYALSRNGRDIPAMQSAALTEQVLAMGTGTNPNTVDSSHRAKMPRGTLLSWIDAPGERAALQESLDAFRLSQKIQQSTAREINAIDLRLQQKITLLQNEVATQSAFLETIRELHSRGFASRAKLLQQQSQVNAIRSDVLSHQERLAANQAQRLQAEIATKKAGVSLVKALRTYSDRTLIFADHDLYITGVITPHLTPVNPGDAVLRVSRDSLNRLPEIIPGFLSQKTAQQVRPDMPGLATPSGMSRAQHGGMLAKVMNVEILPSSLTELRQSLGSEGAAEEITRLIPEPIQVSLQLEEDPSTEETNKGGLKWSSAGDIPYPVRQGDLLSVQITTAKVRPISLLIPWLQQISGTSAPMVPPKNNASGSR